MSLTSSPLRSAVEAYNSALAALGSYVAMADADQATLARFVMRAPAEDGHRAALIETPGTDRPGRRGLGPPGGSAGLRAASSDMDCLRLAVWVAAAARPAAGASLEWQRLRRECRQLAR